MRGKDVSAMGRGSVTAVALVASLAFPGVGRAQTPPSSQSPPFETPTGWLGVRLSDEGIFSENGAAFFERYPVVSNVEPGSPASKAGVLPGDVILTFNSHDMRGGTLQLSNWMKPGAAFELRVRRNEGVRLVRGVLGRRPDGWEQRIVVQVSPNEQIFLRRSAEERAPGGLLQSGVRVWTEGSTPPRLPSLLVPALGLGRGLYPFAGAEFTALNNDLSDVLGVKPEGVFVANVVEGSIAREAGLRGGDVVVMADKIKIDNPNDLVRAIRSADDRSITLQVIRKHKPQTITLKW
ncbi:MAG TPA: PDZ domain-containing protein [Gemmatimonadaceae bacterium]|nr:PDZ domain-containing protein [Gemmatimonadaceae bacterium]